MTLLCRYVDGHACMMVGPVARFPGPLARRDPRVPLGLEDQWDPEYGTLHL